LAIVHNVDWKALGFDQFLAVPLRLDACAQTMIEVTRRRFERFRIEAMPIFLEACEWLTDRAPIASKICLCKGTNGLGEEVFRDGKIVAMSDWEEVSIGDPAADFAFMQNFAPEIERRGKNVWGLEKALAFYEQVSGIHVEVSSVRYYFNLRSLATLVFSHNAARAVSQSDAAQIRQAWTGTEIVYIAKRLLGAAMSLAAPLAPSRYDDLNESLV